MGTPTINFACLLTLLFVIRKPPTYTIGDPVQTADYLNKSARVIFSFLIIGHFFTTIFRLFLRSAKFKKWVVGFVSVFMAIWGVLDASIA